MPVAVDGRSSVVFRVGRREFAVVLGPALTASVCADRTIPCVVDLDIPTSSGGFRSLICGLPDGLLHAVYMMCCFLLIVPADETIASLLDGSLIVELIRRPKLPNSLVRRILVSPLGSVARVYVKMRLPRRGRVPA
jgi:hypothetical protein